MNNNIINDKKDFFISYNEHDKQWAEWIAWQLEKVKYEVLLQQWDWGPGSNFIIEMQKAAERCERTIIVLSPHFLSSLYTQPEWAQAFANDPTGEKRLLIPVRVEQCELKGFFKPLVYIDFLESTPLNKKERKKYLIEKLLGGVHSNRKKPKTEPPLPDFRRADNLFSLDTTKNNKINLLTVKCLQNNNTVAPEVFDGILAKLREDFSHGALSTPLVYKDIQKKAQADIAPIINLHGLNCFSCLDISAVSINSWWGVANNEREFRGEFRGVPGTPYLIRAR